MISTERGTTAGQIMSFLIDPNDKYSHNAYRSPYCNVALSLLTPFLSLIIRLMYLITVPEHFTNVTSLCKCRNVPFRVTRVTGWRQQRCVKLTSVADTFIDSTHIQIESIA